MRDNWFKYSHILKHEHFPHVMSNNCTVKYQDNFFINDRSNYFHVIPNFVLSCIRIFLLWEFSELSKYPDSNPWVELSMFQEYVCSCHGDEKERVLMGSWGIYYCLWDIFYVDEDKAEWNFSRADLNVLMKKNGWIGLETSVRWRWRLKWHPRGTLILLNAKF